SPVQSMMLLSNSWFHNYECFRICFCGLSSSSPAIRCLVAMALATALATRASSAQQVSGGLTTLPSSEDRSGPLSAVTEVTDRHRQMQLDRRIWRELNASAGAARELKRLKPAERTFGRALQLCLSQEPDMFCAWFAVTHRPAGLGADGIVRLTCFNELQHTCNRVSSKNRGRHTQCRPACAPCRSLPTAADASESGAAGLVSDSLACPGCSQKCFCTCDFIQGSNSSYQLSSAYYPCHQLCSGDAKCPSEADESPANCDDYAATAPNFLFYVVVLGCIGGVAALCSLPFVLPKVRKYCCRGPSERELDGGATTAVSRPAAQHQHHHQRHQHHKARPSAGGPETDQKQTEAVAFLPPQEAAAAADADGAAAKA
ncbi:hypothetical protein BOX15_Mlig033271g1, partial [Macrostomum lignano]